MMRLTRGHLRQSAPFSFVSSWLFIDSKIVLGAELDLTIAEFDGIMAEMR